MSEHSHQIHGKREERDNLREAIEFWDDKFEGRDPNPVMRVLADAARRVLEGEQEARELMAQHLSREHRLGPYAIARLLGLKKKDVKALVVSDEGSWSFYFCKAGDE